MSDRRRQPARTKAVAHFERTGLILPGHQGEIAEYLTTRPRGCDS